MLEKKLEKLGLNKNEAKVYLAGLQLGEASGNRIAQKAGIKRTTTYGLIKSLQEKGLFVASKKKGMYTYIAEEPYRFESALEEKLKIAKNIIPELLSITNIIDKKPKIEFYEGKEALYQIFNDTLRYPNQEYVNWISNLTFYHNYDADYWDNHYVLERIKKKIWMRAIFPDDENARMFQAEDNKYLRKTRIDKTGKNKIEVMLVVYGKRKVAMFSTDELIGLIIESERLHNTLKSLFEIHWASLEIENRK